MYDQEELGESQRASKSQGEFKHCSIHWGKTTRMSLVGVAMVFGYGYVIIL